MHCESLRKMHLISCSVITVLVLVGIHTVVHSNDIELEYVLLNNSSECRRVCIEGGPPMICRYKFHVEWYQTMSKACYDCPLNVTDCYRPECVAGDGVSRPIVVVNRQLPGTSIEVCQGDRIIVDVENNMMAESTTIHWHGFHQRGTPYMDGVPFVTQCPIPVGSTFRYQFYAYNVGTHFWHSHSGLQRADGAFGPFVVRVPQSQNPHADLYDHDLSEHTMVIMDWEHQIEIARFTAHHHSNGDNKPPTLLVNGRGKFRAFNNTGENEQVYTPLSIFPVTQGYRYRFRVINAEFLNCPIEISIDNHTLNVISTDGNDIQPVEAVSLVTYAGERFDFIVDANQTIGNYWIRFRGLMDCDERFTRAYQVAVLRYLGAPDEEPNDDVNYESTHRDGLQINALNVRANQSDSITAAELKTLDEDDPSLKEVPDVQYYISYDFYDTDNDHYHKKDLYGFHQVPDKKKRLYTPQLNHISLKLQPFPLLSNRDKLTPEMVCNETTVSGCEDKYCECTHIVNVPLNSVVELILVDRGFTFDANHPFHLHGHYFRVIAMDRLGKNVTVEEVKEFDRLGLINRNLHKAPMKDTVTVPDGGFTILRWHATNLGYWLFHCHIEFHVEIGMALIFKVGEHQQFPPVPKHFPQCDNWMPVPALEQPDVTEKSTAIQKIDKINFTNNSIFSHINQTFLQSVSHLWSELMYLRSSGAKINSAISHSLLILSLTGIFAITIPV